MVGLAIMVIMMIIVGRISVPAVYAHAYGACVYVFASENEPYAIASAHLYM